MIHLPILDYFIIGKGPTVLFLHGWGQNKEMMIPLAEKLKHKYKCVFTDMPGFGKSTYNQEKNIDEYCKNIHDFLIDKLHINPSYIVGHSFGGKVAINYYLMFKRLKGVILIASPILKPKRNWKYHYKLYLYKLKKKLKIKTDMGSIDYKNSGDMKSFFVNVVNTHYDKRLKELKLRTLLIYSKEDTKVDFSKAKKLKRKLDTRMRVIKGEHFAYLDNVDLISLEINDFIKENEKKREYYM